MSYPYGSPNQYPAQPSAGYGAYWPQFTSASDQRTSRAHQLLWVILALGVATYLVGYAAVTQPAGAGWDVRFATLAAIVAALDLLPRQSAHAKLVVAFAVMGFLDALPQLIVGDQNPNWATITIVVINALQALTAIAALLAQLRAPSTDDRGQSAYDTYAYYAQAAQQYYAANDQQLQQQPARSQATAQAQAAAPAQTQQSDAERYALYEEYLRTQQSGPRPAASSTQPVERTRTAQPASGIGIPRTGPADIRPSNDPATGSPTQSS